MDNAESTAIGALMVAAVTMGEYADVAEAFDRIREGAGAKEYTVNEEKHEVYEKLRAKMMERYRRENV